MKGLALAGLVDADIRIGAGQSQVEDVAQDVPFGVLGAGPSEVCANAQEDGRGLQARIASDRQPAQEKEAAPVEQLLAKLAQPGTQ